MANKRIEYGYRKKDMIEKVLSFEGWVTHTFGSLGGSWIKNEDRTDSRDQKKYCSTEV